MHRSKDKTNKKFYNFPLPGTAMCWLKAMAHCCAHVIRKEISLGETKMKNSKWPSWSINRTQNTSSVPAEWVSLEETVARTRFQKFILLSLAKYWPHSKSSHPFTWLIFFTSPLFFMEAANKVDWWPLAYFKSPAFATWTPSPAFCWKIY